MLLSHFRAVLAAVLCFVASANASITVDDFSVGGFSEALNQTNPGIDQTQTGLATESVIGGHRTTWALLNGLVGPEDQAIVTVDTSDQTMRIAGETSLEAYDISYGLERVTPFVDPPALNFDLTPYNAFRIDIISSVQHVAHLAVKSGVDEFSAETSLAAIQFFSATTPYSIIVPFTTFFSFGDPTDFTDIDHIRITSGPLAGGFDLVLGGISIVPEPTSLSLFLSAGLMMIRLQRKEK